MKWIAILCLISLVAVASARIPVEGDSVRITVLGGPTYYGTVQGVEDGLISLACIGVSDEKPLLYEEKNLFGGRKDLIGATPHIQDINQTDICIGTGSIIELAWV